MSAACRKLSECPANSNPFSLISGEHTYSLIANDGKGNTAQTAKVIRCKNPMPTPAPASK